MWADQEKDTWTLLSKGIAIPQRCGFRIIYG
jgi:hypothetical protein